MLKRYPVSHFVGVPSIFGRFLLPLPELIALAAPEHKNKAKNWMVFSSFCPYSVTSLTSNQFIGGHFCPPSHREESLAVPLSGLLKFCHWMEDFLHRFSGTREGYGCEPFDRGRVVNRVYDSLTAVGLFDDDEPILFEPGQPSPNRPFGNPAFFSQAAVPLPVAVLTEAAEIGVKVPDGPWDCSVTHFVDPPGAMVCFLGGFCEGYHASSFPQKIFYFFLAGA
jgi:hypothetical protein